MSALDEARSNAAARESARKPIDYARMQKVWPKQKAALTRAKNTGDPNKIAAVCVAAMNEWDEIGAWPDDWSLFQRTLSDALPWHSDVNINDLPRR